MANLKDVARRAKTSVGSVSMVLNDKRSVSPGLRERILTAVRELDYKPNLVARTLRSRKSGILGLIISDIRNPFYTQVACAIQSQANKHGYHLMAVNTFEDTEIEAEYINDLYSYNVDGLIIAPARGDHTHLQILNTFNIPTVLINRRLTETNLQTLIADNFTASKEAVKHFLKNNRKNIGLVLGSPDVSHNIDRLEGYREALKDNNIAFDPDLVIYTSLFKEEITSIVGNYLRIHNNLDALFCGSRATTLASILAINELGLHIPSQIAIIGSGNIEWASVLNPPLTYYSQPTNEMGIQAVDLLLEKIKLQKGKHPISQEIFTPVTLASHLVHGGSCGCEYPE